MIRGVDVWASFASDENGYVELTPEAATNAWAMIGTLVSATEIILSSLTSEIISLQLLTEVSKGRGCW